MTLMCQGHSYIQLFLKSNGAAGVDASEKPTRPCVVHICVYIYVSKWSYVWPSEWNEMACTCVIICVFPVSGSLRSIFTRSSLSCLETIREPDYRTDTMCWCREASSSVLHTRGRQNPRNSVTKSHTHTHQFVLVQPSVATRTNVLLATSDPSATRTWLWSRSSNLSNMCPLYKAHTHTHVHDINHFTGVLTYSPTVKVHVCLTTDSSGRRLRGMWQRPKQIIFWPRTRSQWPALVFIILLFTRTCIH